MRRPQRALCALLLLLPAALGGCSRAFWAAAGHAIAGAARDDSPLPASLPRTRAERTDYRETSRHADVVAFLDSLQSLGAPIRVGVMGESTEGREIPYVIASRPLISGPEEARRLGRPIVYVQGNIHAGEVEGKEALQMLLRDLVFGKGPNALDSLVLIAVPIYNADGNERLAPQAVNREEQNGPEIVGERANARRLDLNRDYVKAEAVETRAALALFDAWDPDVFVDLHTTDGSYHGYALTYAPSLTPASPLGAYVRDSVLPELRRRMRERHRFETFDYGNFSLEYGADVSADTTKQGWYSYDHRPRYGTNYYGLRGRVSILSEAFSHDPFERRVASTYAFVGEILSWAGSREARLVAHSAAADSVGRADAGARARREVAIRARLTPTPYVGDVVAEDLVRAADTSVLSEPGVPRAYRRTGRLRTVRIPVYDRFTPTLSIAAPPAYTLDPSQGDAVRLLRLLGIVVERLTADAEVDGEAFGLDSVVASQRPFQGHREVRLSGRWRPVRRVLPAGSYVVPTDQPRSTLAVYLLEPESDDGLATWNLFDRGLRPGGEFPVLRVTAPIAAARRAEP
jgi:hypothetical protein